MHESLVLGLRMIVLTLLLSAWVDRAATPGGCSPALLSFSVARAAAKDAVIVTNFNIWDPGECNLLLSLYCPSYCFDLSFVSSFGFIIQTRGYL